MARRVQQDKIFIFSNMGNVAHPGRARWLLDVQRPIEVERNHVRHRRFSEIVSEFQVEEWERGPIEDLPWTEPWYMLVSKRLKQFLESEAPGAAEFLPAVIRRKGRFVKRPPYWVANWLQVVDCVDLKKSEFRRVRDRLSPGGYRYSFDRAVIDTSRIPESVSICEVRRCGYVIIRAPFAKRLRQEGFTGFQLYPTAHY